MLFSIEMMFAFLFLPSIGQKLYKVKGILHCSISFPEILIKNIVIICQSKLEVYGSPKQHHCTKPLPDDY